MRILTLLFVVLACAVAVNAGGKAKPLDGKALQRTYWDIIGEASENEEVRRQWYTANLLDLAKECKNVIRSGKGTPDVHLALGRVLEDLAYYHEAAIHYEKAGVPRQATAGRDRCRVAEAVANAARRGLRRRFVRDVERLPGSSDCVVLLVDDENRIELGMVRRRRDGWRRVALIVGNEDCDSAGTAPGEMEDLSLRALGGRSGLIAIRDAGLGASYNPSHVSVFRWTGKRFRRLWGSHSSWEVKCRDLDRDGVDEIITSRTLGLWGDRPIKCAWNDIYRWNGRTIVEANARYAREFKEAHDDLKAALTQDPNEPELLLHLGIVCEMRREPNRALDAYRKADSALRRKLQKLPQVTGREYRMSLESEYRSAEKQLKRRITRLSKPLVRTGRHRSD